MRLEYGIILKIRFSVYQNAIYCALKRIGVSYKKSLIHNRRDDKERLAYQEVLQGYEKDNISIVYLDECGFLVIICQE